MSACAFARACVCTFADASACAGARTCARVCAGAHVPVCMSKCVGAHASALEGSARGRACGCACVRVLCMHDLPYLTI